jgi:hypothetical protein
MTIGDYLRKQTRTINTIKWVGVGLAVVMAFVHGREPGVIAYAWIVAPMIPAIGIMMVLGRRLRCPRCQTALNQQLLLSRDRVPLLSCPKCGADFNEPLPHYPISG